MQPGSLVVILPYEESIAKWIKPYINWLPKGDNKTPYVIRGILRDLEGGEAVATFEEGEIGRHPETGCEFGVDVKYIREIQNPHEIDALEIVEEALFINQ